MVEKFLKVRDIELGTGEPKIIVPVTGGATARRTAPEVEDASPSGVEDVILSQAQEIMRLSAADLVEWRADYFLSRLKPEFNAAGVIETLRALRDILGETPLIFTIRTKLEGGELDINFDDYAALNLAVADSGLADIIDVEVIGDLENVKNLIENLKKLNCFVIGSKHDFERTPPRDEIIKILLRAQDADADILKIAVMPESAGAALSTLNPAGAACQRDTFQRSAFQCRELSTIKSKNDVLNLISASAEFCDKYASRPVIAISMGRLGTLSRIACEFSGSCATFGAVGDTSAPGQFSAVELRKILNIFKNF